jgi:integrase
VLPEALAQAGQAANQAAARARFNDYQSRRANQTLRRQQADLDLFAIFFDTLTLPAGDFFHDPLAWQPVTWGLVEAFVKWQVARGYAIPSINVRLSTVKTYARLAMQAGALSIETYSLIRTVQGYSLRESRRVNARRTVQRIGLKKAEAIRITHEQALALKTHPNQPQGRRDTLMMCLLLDHGLRVGEVAGLTISNLDLKEGLLRFFRSKVGKTQVHRLSSDTLRAANAYANFHDLPAPTPEMPDPPLLRESLKNEHLSEAGMSTRAITQRVRTLGDQIGLPGLSAHDCRHFWATSAARHGTDPFSLQQAGGWSSLAMPRRYIEDNDIANDGVNLE